MFLIKNGMNTAHPCYGIVASCRNVFDQIPDFSIKHVFRECNKVADYLANLSYQFELGFHVLEKTPKGAELLFLLDFMGSFCSLEVLI